MELLMKMRKEMVRVKGEVVLIQLVAAVVVRIGWHWIGVTIPRASCAVLDMFRDH